MSFLFPFTYPLFFATNSALIPFHPKIHFREYTQYTYVKQTIQHTPTDITY